MTYDLPETAPRNFSDDYPAERWPDGPPVGADGRLTHDIDGRPIQPGARVVGRSVVGGEDIPLSPQEYDAITEAAIGSRPEAVEARALPKGSVGSFREGFTPEGIPERDIYVLNTLPPNEATKVTAHEMGHMIDRLARGLASAPGIDQTGIRNELRQIYHDLNDPTWRRGRRLAGSWDMRRRRRMTISGCAMRW